QGQHVRADHVHVEQIDTMWHLRAVSHAFVGNNHSVVVRECVVDCGTHATGCHHAGYDERVDIMEREHALEWRSEECAGLAFHNHRPLGTRGDLGRDLGGFAAGRIVGTAEDAGA